ncbi:hypothetical protein [Wolbachia endosymbiont of Cantharis cryptica]|uniref:hypothetical protein n=1 Tax=Wolbachia endosymbiont of Cantharis cryptica TaxID=3066132 RepID=UPI00376F1AD6
MLGTNKEQSIQILEKHFHDRTVQPLSDFPKVKKKEAGCSSGFQAEHQYSNDEKDKATFMMKSVLNRTLTGKDKQSKLGQFKESFYKSSRKAIKLQDPSLTDSTVDALLAPMWQQTESNICYDDLNIADFIREYVAGDLYKLLLQDRAPIVELVTNNDLPKKRFVKNEVQNSEDHKKYEKGKYKFNDQFKEQVKEEKVQEELHLRSKFLVGKSLNNNENNEFTTLADLRGKGKEYQNSTGFEKILAAQILLGEADTIQAENFGVIEKEYENAKGRTVKEKLWAKIDHGRSLYSCVKHWSQILLYDFNALYGVGVDYKVLASELSNYVKLFSENDELIDRLIDKKVSNLNQIFNPKMTFTLRYLSSRMPAILCEEVFSYSDQSQEFISDKGSSLNQYFKQRLKNQVKVMTKYSEVLLVTSAMSNNFQNIITLSQEFFISQHTDPLIWAIEAGKKLDGKDPIIWAIDNSKKIDNQNSIVWAIEAGKKLDGKDPIIWAIDSSKKIDNQNSIVWAIDNSKKIDNQNPIVWAINTGEDIKEKKPIEWAKEHNLLINGKNPEIFASKVQLTKFVNKASLPIAVVAAAVCIGFFIANLSIALIISVAVVALAALITKPIASYVQKGLLENSVVSKNLDNLDTEQHQAQAAGQAPS